MKQGPQVTNAVVAELIARAQQPDGKALMQFRSAVGAHQYRALYGLLSRYLHRDAHVLDWGAGNGHFSYVCSRVGLRTTAYSLERGSLDWLPADRCEVVYGSERDPVALPFDDACFDAVTSVGVLEHVRETGGDELSSLHEIARVLRPGGVLLCVHLPNRYSLIEAAARYVPQKHHHELRYTTDEIVALLAETGLRSLEMRRYGLLPRNLWQHAPARLRRSRLLAGLWDVLDDTLAFPLSMLCQNYLFVARREPYPARITRS